MWRRWLFLKRHRCSTPAEKQYHLEDVIMHCFVFISFTFVSLVGDNCDHYRACKKGSD